MNTISKLALGAVATCAVALTAFASVTVDENGLGFVGKGDVQLAYDWNNAQLQANAGGLTFSFTSTEEASWDCEWDTGPTKNITHHVQTRTTTQNVSANIAFDARKNKTGQITGFNLNGFSGAPTTTVTGPELWNCPEGGTNMTITNQQTTVVDGGTLSVSFDNDVKPLAISQ